MLGSTNVYTGPGYRTPERMLVQTPLVSGNADLLEAKGMRQTRTTTVLGGAQPKLSKMLRRQLRGFLERKLMDCLTRLREDARIVVRRRADNGGAGAVSVTFA